MDNACKNIDSCTNYYCCREKSCLIADRINPSQIIPVPPTKKRKKSGIGRSRARSRMVIKEPNGAVTIYKRGSILSIRHIVYARDGHKCLACGATERLTLDHIIPKSIGGTNEEDNLQTLCFSCNTKKGNRIRDYRKKDIFPDDFPKFEKAEPSIKDYVVLS